MALFLIRILPFILREAGSFASNKEAGFENARLLANARIKIRLSFVVVYLKGFMMINFYDTKLHPKKPLRQPVKRLNLHV
jgi:hypothetical protein